MIKENLHTEENPKVFDLSEMTQILANEFNTKKENILNGSLSVFKELSKEEKERILNNESIGVSVVVEKVLNSGYDSYRIRGNNKPNQGQLFLLSGKLTNYCG